MIETRESRRAKVLETMADHMLQQGLAGSSLRSLAAASHTSDRMLLYYFTDKNDLLVAALQTISQRLATMLRAALPETPSADDEAELHHLSAVLRGAAMRPYMRLWLELAVKAARQEEPYRLVAGRIADGFIAWVASRIAGGDMEARRARAARLIATLDGLVLLDAVGKSDMAALALQPCANQPTHP